MNIHILKQLTLETLVVIDDYYSLIWTDRHAAFGDFELRLPIKYASNTDIVKGRFVRIPDSDHIMVIDTIKVESGETENSLILSGESGESILKRRWILFPQDVDDPSDDVMYNLVHDNFLISADTKRNIPILGGLSTAPGGIGILQYAAQLEPQPVYDALVNIAKFSGLGFEVVHGPDLDYLYFNVTAPVDRTPDQSVLPYVIFSDKFDNVLSGSYVDTIRDARNLCFVRTDDSTYQSLKIWNDDTEPQNLWRFECGLFMEIDRNIDPGYTLTDAEVLAIITTGAREEIYKSKAAGYFDGDFDINGAFKLGTDFFMGDVVQVFVEGKEAKAKIVEIVRSYAADGEKTHVTMDFLDVKISD